MALALARNVLCCCISVACAGCQGARTDDLQRAQDRGTRAADAAEEEFDAGNREEESAPEPQTASDSGSASAPIDAFASDPEAALDSVDASMEGGNTAALDTLGSLDAGAARALRLAFSPMYSAYDGRRVFRVPLRVEGASGRLTVTATPSGFVDSVASSFGAMLTMRQAGRAIVQVSDEAGNTASASLTVTLADADDYARGESQYHAPLDGGTAPDASVNTTPTSCASCHVAGQGIGPDGGGQLDVEHTPQQLGGHSDDDLIALLTQARRPVGAPFRVVNAGGLLPDSVAAQIFARFHAWNFDDAARRGLVAYLRGLEPQPQGWIDFGGLLRLPAR